MNRNLLGIGLLVVAIELAVVLVALLANIPDKLGRIDGHFASPKDGSGIVASLAGIERRLGELEDRARESRSQTETLKQTLDARLAALDPKRAVDPKEASRKNADAEAHKDMLSRIDDIGTMIYDFERNVDKSLLQVQKNLLKRMSRGDATSAGRYPKDDPAKLEAALAKDGLRLELAKGRCTLPARVATPNRPLELVAASEGGPLHEALLEIESRPQALRAAIEAMGGVAGHGADAGRGPVGSQLWLYLTWKGLEKPRPLEDFIQNANTTSSMKEQKWVFAGSDFDTNFRTGEDFYIPDESRVLIALTWNFSNIAVIACDHAEANNEYVWMPRTEALPTETDIDLELIVAVKPIE